jgi:hypothetical protein
MKTKIRNEILLTLETAAATELQQSSSRAAKKLQKSCNRAATKLLQSCNSLDRADPQTH